MNNVCVLLSLSFILTLPCHARSFRNARIPNGTVASCSNCHVNPSGGGTRTPFGVAVFTAIGGTSNDVAFWNAALALADADGDGANNGTELRDPDGDGTPIDAIGVTNPGNRPPVFTSTATTSATMGIAYSYQAAATDAESNARTYAKNAGPSWIAVSTTGLVTGTPPANSAGTQNVVIRATDSGTATTGFSRGSTDQSYILNIGSSFTGWQNLNFTLPAQAAIATNVADPDNDGLNNLTEYALRLPPLTGSAISFSGPTLTPARLLRLSLAVRDDDAKLSVVMETASELPFAIITTNTTPTVTDPVLGDGLRTLEFIDTVTGTRRFGRIKFTILP
jgi:Putative Ig domain